MGKKKEITTTLKKCEHINTQQERSTPVQNQVSFYSILNGVADSSTFLTCDFKSPFNATQLKSNKKNKKVKVHDDVCYTLNQMANSNAFTWTGTKTKQKDYGDDSQSKKKKNGNLHE